MNKQVGIIMAFFCFWVIVSAYWYTCNIKYLCNKGIGSFFSNIRLQKPAIKNDSEVKNEINIPFRFEGYGTNASLDGKSVEEIKKMTEDVKNGSKVLITGQEETEMSEKVSTENKAKRVRSVVAILKKYGIDEKNIIVVTEGTLEALNLDKYKLPNRRVVLIIGDMNTK